MRCRVGRQPSGRGVLAACVDDGCDSADRGTLLFAYLTDHIANRHADLGTDLLSQLLSDEEEGWPGQQKSNVPPEPDEFVAEVSESLERLRRAAGGDTVTMPVKVGLDGMSVDLRMRSVSLPVVWRSGF